MTNLADYLPGLLLLSGQVIVAVAHVLADRRATTDAAQLLEHPLAQSDPKP